MAFRESPRFPDELSFGSSGGPMFRTHVVMMKSGREQRNQCWSQGLAVYDIGLANRQHTTTQLLRRFFRSIAQGRRHGFRFHDPLPGEDRGFQEVLGTGDADNAMFQLVKHYALGGYAHIRTITKPVVGSVRMYLDGVVTTAFTVETTTGLVTMTSAPGIGVVVTATYLFDVPVRFDSDHLELQRLDFNTWNWPSIRLLETRTLA